MGVRIGRRNAAIATPATDGTCIASLRIPGHSHPVEIGGGYVVGASRDVREIQAVHKHRLSR